MPRRLPIRTASWTRTSRPAPRARWIAASTRSTGATVEHAPTEVTPVTTGEEEYGYANGAYYEASVGDDGEAEFTVVEPPVGGIVPSLPEGAEKKTVGDADYFVYTGTFYKPFYSGADVVYMVVLDPTG